MAKTRENRISIVQVLKDHGVNPIGEGDNLKALSPFRAASSIDSFTICVTKNTFHDWKLGPCGGPVKFISLLYNLEEDEAREYLSQKYFGEGATLPPMVKQDIEAPKLPPLNLDNLDKAYRLFLSLCSLSDTDKEYLRDVRHLSDKEIDDWGFKTFPLRTIRKKVHKLIVDNGIDPTTIPGFFKYKGDEFVTWSRYVGILIPIRAISGNIVGLQIRRTKLEKPTDSRYVWFSSAFAVNKEGEDKFDSIGRSPESPVGVVPATMETRRVRTLFITEGFFKAIALQKNLGSPSITIQGITNWKGIRNTLAKLREIYPRINRVIFALDADLITNLNVSVQMTKIWKEIMSDDIDCFAMLWDVSKGKGIDDLIETVTTITNHIGLMPMEDFNSAFTEFEPKGKEFIKLGVSDEEFSKEYRRVLAKYWKGK